MKKICLDGFFFFLEFKSFDVTYFNSIFFSLPPKTYFTLTVPASGLIFITCPTPPGLLIPGQVRDCTTTISFNRYGKFSFVVVDIFVFVVFEKLVDFVEAPSLFVTNLPLLALFSFLVVVVLDKNDEPGDGASDNICCLFTVILSSYLRRFSSKTLIDFGNLLIPSRPFFSASLKNK